MDFEAMAAKKKRLIWVKAIIYGSERALITSALEAATVMVLETEFGWDTTSAGLAVGLTFFASIPVTLCAKFVQRQGVSNLVAMRCFSICTVIGCVCFFPQITSAPIALLVADAWSFAFGYLAQGIISGFASKACNKEGAFTLANFGVYNLFCMVVVRLIAAPVARSLLAAGGRTAYATVQLVIATMGCISCVSINGGTPVKVVDNEALTHENHVGVADSNVKN